MYKRIIKVKPHTDSSISSPNGVTVLRCHAGLY